MFILEEIKIQDDLISESLYKVIGCKESLWLNIRIII